MNTYFMVIFNRKKYQENLLDLDAIIYIKYTSFKFSNKNVKSMSKFIDAPIVAFNAVMTGSPFSVLKVESFNKRTLECRCVKSKVLFKIHHNCKGFKPQTNDFVLVQRKGIGTTSEIAKVMDYNSENTWKRNEEYSPAIDSSIFTYEMQNELEEVAS
jgi:hypothetical protein